MRSFRSIIAVCLTTLAATAGVITLGATPAAAGTVAVNYICGLPGVYAGADQITTTITAPANAVHGQAVDLTISMIGQGRFSNAVPAGRDHATLTIKLGGASSGNITTTGLTNPYIPPGGQEQWIGGHAQATLANVGDVTFTPGGITATIASTSGYLCALNGPAPVAATTHVS